MPLDHYLSATYLASFSFDSNPVRRERRLWAADRCTGRLFQTPASKLCAARDFYTARGNLGWDSRSVDRALAGHERRLSNAIDGLIDGTIDANVWLTLVLFVASLMVRSSDFERRFVARPGIREVYRRFPHAYGRDGRDNTNFARVLEQQRLFPSVISARWVLLETSGNVVLITNDIGYTPFFDQERNETGIAIPVGPMHILMIAPTMKRVIVQAKEGRWRPCIERGTLLDSDSRLFSDCIADAAQRFVIGPSEESVRRYAVAQKVRPLMPEPAMLGFFSGPLARDHEMIFLHLCSALAKPPDGSVAGLSVDFEKGSPLRGSSRQN
jgi:hypothetical protein